MFGIGGRDAEESVDPPFVCNLIQIQLRMSLGARRPQGNPTRPSPLYFLSFHGSCTHDSRHVLRAAVAFVVGLAFLLSVGELPDPDDMGQSLPFVNAHRTNLIIALGVIGILVMLDLAALPGIYQVLRNRGAFVLVALVASVVGLLPSIVFLSVLLAYSTSGTNLWFL